MKANTLRKRFSACLLSAVLASGMTAGTCMAVAADPVVTNSTIILSRYTEADPNATIPDTRFFYSAVPLGIGAGSDTADMPAITIGNVQSAVAENTTAAGISFQGTAHPYTGYFAERAIDLSYSETENDVSTSDGTGVNWPHAGTYRYYVKESPTTEVYWTSAAEGYVISVYVVNGDGSNGFEEGTLGTQYVTVNTAVLSGTEVTDANLTVGAKVDATAYRADTPSGGGLAFIGKYYPVTSLIVRNLITGNASDPEKTFTYTISDLVLPEKTGANIQKDGEKKTTFSARLSSLHGNTLASKAVVPGEDFTFTIGDTDLFSIEGLPAGTTYKITQAGAANYAVSSRLVQGEGTALLSDVQAGEALSVQGTVKAIRNIANSLNEARYTDDYTISAPTGILTDSTPAGAGVLASLLLIGGAVLLSVRKSRRSRK